MMAYTKRFNNVEKLVNHSTGEVITTSKSFTIQVRNEEFFMVFLSQMGPLYKLRSATDIVVLAKLCEITDFNSNMVALTPARRRKIQEDAGISSQQITNSLRHLKRLDLISGEGGDFEINPAVAWKGSLEERKKLLDSGKLKFEVQFVNEEPSGLERIVRNRRENPEPHEIRDHLDPDADGALSKSTVPGPSPAEI